MLQTLLFSLATKISGLSCPRCTSTANYKYGKHLDIQRYKCKCCGRTYNETVNTPLHGIRDKQKMQDYILTMHEQQSIRAASKQLGISVPTSFSWRHRILSSLREQPTSQRTSPAGICEIKLPHSFKGKRGVHDKKMPETHSILISDACGIPRLQLLVKPQKTFEAALLVINSLHTTDKIGVVTTNLLSRVARKLIDQKTQSRSVAMSLAKQAVENADKLSAWMARFSGVATKYLQQYWNWYRAEVNFTNYDQFINECFGQRQLQYFRKIQAG